MTLTFFFKIISTFKVMLLKLGLLCMSFTTYTFIIITFKSDFPIVSFHKEHLIWLLHVLEPRSSSACWQHSKQGNGWIRLFTDVHVHVHRFKQQLLSALLRLFSGCGWNLELLTVKNRVFWTLGGSCLTCPPSSWCWCNKQLWWIELLLIIPSVPFESQDDAQAHTVTPTFKTH